MGLLNQNNAFVGFGTRWIDGLKIGYSPARLKLFLKVRPEKKNNLQNRSKTGDPLSPLMFVLMADWLNNMFRKLEGRGI